jgi:RimJ/RimL family protein N-acetyltransferase
LQLALAWRHTEASGSTFIVRSRQLTSELPAIINIAGERASLGPLRRELIPLYTQWSNDLATSQTIGLTWPITLDQESERYDARIHDPAAVWFTIYDQTDSRPIGLAWLYDVDHRHARASFGISIGNVGDRGRGLGTEATRLTLDYAFTSLGLQNVMLTVLAFNKAGISAYERAGFRVFGRRRNCSHANGKLHDIIYMECVPSEFTPPASRSFLYDEQSNTQD